MKKTLAVMMVGAAMSLLAGCDDGGGPSVPDPYTGTFQDNATGAVLKLATGTASFTVGGRTISNNVTAISYDVLLAGQAGFYLDQTDQNGQIIDVYWITPNLATKQEAGGLIYYTADIAFLQIDLSAKSAVPSIRLVHSDSGRVMLDTESKTWQAGWPPQALEYNLLRSATPN